MEKIEEKEEEYCEPGSIEYVRGKWKLGIEQYLSYVNIDTGISIKDLLEKLNVELATEDGIIGLKFSITSDRAYEAFIHKGGEDREDSFESTFDDVLVVRKLIKNTLEDLNETD
jgi:hypothetical protein